MERYSSDERDSELKMASAGCLKELNIKVENFEFQPNEKPIKKDNTSGYVMISYCHQDKKIVTKLQDALKMQKIKYWIDDEKMTGDIFQKMDEAVSKAAVVAICFSQAYKNSSACRAEALTAKALDKPIFPLRVQKGYQYDGWLRAALIGLMYYDISVPEREKRDIPKILEELHPIVGGEKKEQKPENVTTSDTQATSNAKKEESSTKSSDSGGLKGDTSIPAQMDISKMNIDQVQEWLDKTGLTKLKEKYTFIQGGTCPPWGLGGGTVVLVPPGFWQDSWSSG